MFIGVARDIILMSCQSCRKLLSENNKQMIFDVKQNHLKQNRNQSMITNPLSPFTWMVRKICLSVPGKGFYLNFNLESVRRQVGWIEKFSFTSLIFAFPAFVRTSRNYNRINIYLLTLCSQLLAWKNMRKDIIANRIIFTALLSQTLLFNFCFRIFPRHFSTVFISPTKPTTGATSIRKSSAL